jgi:catechol 2,3-dioxygenase
MPLPSSEPTPPFDITRASHVVLDVQDLAASRRFYEELIGLLVTEAEDDVIYLRGVEEACHHSLVLRRAAEAQARRVGFRVRREADLDAAKTWFERRGLPAELVDVPYQGKTLQATDVAGTPLELVARMTTVPRKIVAFSTFKGAAPARLDHYQLHVADVPTATEMYADLGFRISEYVSLDGTPDTSLFGSFMARKGNANDVVLVANEGPRLHHFAYIIHEVATTMLRTCDLASALGYAPSIEWGPARHGLGSEMFLYLRDPDGHRVELLGTPYQFIDEEEEPFGWAADNPTVPMLFGPPPSMAWFNEASKFAGIKTTAPDQPAIMETLAPAAVDYPGARAHRGHLEQRSPGLGGPRWIVGAPRAGGGREPGAHHARPARCAAHDGRPARLLPRHPAGPRRRVHRRVPGGLCGDLRRPSPAGTRRAGR